MRKYLILIGAFVLIFFIAIYLFVDFKNDRKYLLSQGFDPYHLDVEFTGFDNYCRPREKLNNELICTIGYSNRFLYPVFYMNINFGDNTEMGYQKSKSGLFKNENIFVFISPDTSSQVSTTYTCSVDENFNILDNPTNGDYCYSDEYDKFIKDHKEYIDDAVKQFDSYYDNFNIARNFRPI